MLLFLLTLSLLSTWQIVGPSSGSTTCQARLEARQQADQLTFVSYCRNTSPLAATFRYELLTDKYGDSGSTRNTQSGVVTVASREDKMLSQSSFNVGASDTYRVHLRVLDPQGVVLAEDSLLSSPAHPSQKP